jgi:hypothetical protein
MDDVKSSVTHAFFTASAETFEVKAFDGSILTTDSTIVWLAEESGYPTCSREPTRAKRFNCSADAIREQSSKWDGMPWYFRLKPGSLRIYAVAETVTTQIVSKEVQSNGD